MAKPAPRARRRAEPASRPPLRRMAELHRQLQAGEYPNCRKLAEELEVTSKTIQRDIEFMRDQLGLPIQYDRAHLGFYYTAPVTAFPTMEVSAGELVALFVAQKALRQFHGTVFEKSLAAAFRRLEEQWQDKISFDWADLDDAISFHKIGTTAADLRAFEQVSQAVVENRELVFEYRKLEGAEFERRRLQPWHLGSIEHQWYVIGHDLDRRQLRTFALTRMRRARMTANTFPQPDGFSIEGHLKESFGVFAGGRNRHTVRLRFTGAAARLVAERRWHSSQAVKTLPGEALELSFQLCSLREIERWVLSWGARVEVLSPPELIERLQKTVGEMAKRHRPRNGARRSDG